MIHNILLWFLACLFTTEVLFFLLRRLCPTRKALVATLSVLLAAGYYNSTLDHPRLPFGFDVSLVAVFLFGLGYLLRDRILSFNAGIVPMIVLGAAGLGFSVLNGKVDMNGNSYNNIILFLVSSLCSFLFYMNLIRKLPSVDIVERIGRNSLSIFPLQVVVFSAIKMALELAGMRPVGTNDLFAAFLAAAGLLLALPLSELLRKYLPTLVGEYRQADRAKGRTD